MGLKKEVHIKINGKHIRGTIINDNFLSQNLITSPTNNFSIEDVKSVIDELNELLDTMQGVRIADNLSNEDKKSDENILFR